MLVWVHYKHPAELLLMLAGAILGTSAHASDLLQAALTHSPELNTGIFSLSEGSSFMQLEKKISVASTQTRG